MHMAKTNIPDSWNRLDVHTVLLKSSFIIYKMNNIQCILYMATVIFFFSLKIAILVYAASFGLSVLTRTSLNFVF